MSNPYLRTTPEELTLFLDDVKKNVTSDEDTDFKKLLLYLYGFTNAKFEALRSENASTGSSQVLNLSLRLVDTIALVLSKKKHLLNAEITPAEISSVLMGATTVSVPFGNQNVYEWGVHFSMSWLSQFPGNMAATNAVKSLLIGLINSVTVHVNGFKYARQVQLALMRLLSESVNTLFTQVRLIRNHTDTLTATVHLLSVVNDYDVQRKLLLTANATRLQLESFTKRICFVLDAIEFATPEDELLPLVDYLKSVLLHGMTSNLLLDESLKWSQVTYLMTWVHSHFDSFKLHGKTMFQFKTFNKATCLSLMKIFVFCRQKGLVHNFFSSFDTGVFEEEHEFTSVEKLLSVSRFPPSIKKLSHILIHQQAANNNLTLTSNAVILASIPFVDAELDQLRTSILEDETDDPSKALQFITDSQVSFKRYLHSNNSDSLPNVKSWLGYVASLIKLDGSSSAKSPFNNKATLLTFINTLSIVPAILTEDFNYRSGESISMSTLSTKNIFSSISLDRPSILEVSDAEVIYREVICDFLLHGKRDYLLSDSSLIVAFLLALFNIFAAYRPPTKDIEQEPCHMFVLQCLSSSRCREARVIAARVLPLYLIHHQDDFSENVFKSSFSAVSKIKFSDPKLIHMAESTLMALSELAIVCEGEWLCVIFIKMIDCFGEANEQHVNLAYNFLLYVATAKSLTPYKLLSPYLPSIAERIVKKARMFSRITSLLGVSKRFFLSQTRDYTTPRLLEYYKHDFIQEIAEASNMDKTKLVAKTLPRIMATYLCKDDTIEADYIVNVLSNTSPRYQKLSITDLIPNIGEVLWYILLQIQLDENGQIVNETRIFNAIKYVAKINYAKRSSQRPDSQKFDYVKYILGEHVLELVQRFSENVHHIKGIKPFLEKVSSLNAIHFLISRNIEAAASALGQISTCLQASLENPSLELPAIQCWSVLVQKLDSERLVSLFDITISLIFQKFDSLQHRSKQIAVKILEKLFLELREKYKKYALYYFSVPFIKDLDKYFVLDATFISMMKPKSKLSYFPEFTRRLQTNNQYVVHQALDDLLNFTTKYQLSCQRDDFKDAACEDSLSLLVRTLLDVSVQFKNKNSLIARKCAMVLGSIGALDANRFNFKTIDSRIVILYDFQDYRENAEFLSEFIKSRVIKNFWASNDPIRQLFSAYSMQRFLNVMGLDNSILNSSNQGVRAEVWNKFSEIDKSTLTPLLSSKYFAPEPRYEPLSFPYFKLGMKHDKWLVDITTNLLRRPLHNNLKQHGKMMLAKSVIFQTCSLLIRDEEISIAQYLLKYVVLSHIVNGEQEVRKNILDEILTILKLGVGQNSTAERVEELKACYQAVFEVLDYLNEWVSAATHKLSDSSLPKADSSMIKKSRECVEGLLHEIPMELIALTSSECDSYERTILYLEKCYRDGKVKNNNRLDNLSITSTLQSVYSNIDDYDALDGVLKKFSTNNLAEKLDTFQYNQNWAIAQESFEVLSEIGTHEDRVECNTKLLKSLANHGLYHDVIQRLNSKTEKINDLPLPWAMVGLEAATAIADIEEMKKWSTIAKVIGNSTDVEDLFHSRFADSLLALGDGNLDHFNSSISEIYALLGQSLSSSRSSSFSRNSTLMLQLHILYDTASIVTTRGNPSGMVGTEQILKERMSNTDLSFDSHWKMLSMHKTVTVVTGNLDKVSDILLDCSRIARRNERLDIATKCIMNAMTLNDSEANIEYANLLWDQGKQTEAIKTMSDNLATSRSSSLEKQARNQLQYASWLDESSHSSSSKIIAEYSKAYKLDPSWEKPYYDLGRYHSKLMESQNDTSGYFEQQIIRFFLKALALGPSYIFEALPKFITVWLDFAQRPNKTRDAERKLNQIVHDIKTYKNTIPIYVWYTSITQILSRITHQHQPSVELMQGIIESLISAYPKHSLWYVLSHVKSKDTIRRQRVVKVLNTSKATKSLGEIIVSAKSLFEILEGIALKKVKKAQKKRWLLTDDFGVTNLHTSYDSLVIPVKSNLEIKLPATRHTSKPGSAFPKSSSITFDGFDEEVNIFHSLQMPKQITIRGTDSKAYRLMLKRDDTRKDAKVFEFSNMINRLLSLNNVARKRNLIIENYSVIPLAEDMGVIEFVQDVQTMKSVIHEQQKKHGKVPHDRKIFMKLDEAQKVVKAKYASDENAMTALISLFDNICDEFPPVLHQWFIDQFSDPAFWYLARKAYTRTAAVMSIVGYIIGLGDRHCENLLFFKRNGAALHIDFDCLFEKGLTLPTPEIVPFRLTQNMVDAMGIIGIEGTFRITCEVTGQILRENEASLMNILETLIYDPLLDWKTQENPQDHLRKVRRKIRGLLDEKEGLPMNIHGQVDVLIQEATSKENLAQMYGGWAPYV
ncbi:hypothetical protein FT663_03803 [Candidozyma haemuli var. vulneris]|nr:hypothetical protein FT662_05298 [[Candida] haemuloni var. vulneris]KAF3988977.1 hypothetical protein FT663_03803 [[Candida] haemuloni var. vulneris]